MYPMFFCSLIKTLNGNFLESGKLFYATFSSSKFRSSFRACFFFFWLVGPHASSLCTKGISQSDLLMLVHCVAALYRGASLICMLSSLWLHFVVQSVDISSGYHELKSPLELLLLARKISVWPNSQPFAFHMFKLRIFYLIFIIFWLSPVWFW